LHGDASLEEIFFRATSESGAPAPPPPPVSIEDQEPL
jgi:hypothetical protein